MKKQLKLLTLVYILFIILLLVTSALDGIVSDIVYILSFFIPIFFALYLGGDKEERFKFIKLKGEEARLLLPAVFPSVALIFILSFLTSALIYLVLGKESTTVVGDSLPFAIFNHALLPAILEELLFRYLPLRLLAPYSKRVALFFSAACFALAHHSFFSIPYAFVAGIIFMAIDLVAESVLPSMILHFINNILSILWIFYSQNGAFLVVFLSVLSILVIISLVFIYLRRNEYRQRLAPVLVRGEEDFRVLPEMMFLLIPTLALAIAELL